MSVKVEGVERFKAEIAKLPAEIGAKVESKVLRAAAQDMAMEIAAAAPVDWGALERSIVAGKVPSRYIKERGVKAFGVLARRTKMQPGGYYLHLVDRDRKIVTKGKFLKRVHGTRKGDQFVKEVFDKHHDRIIDEMSDAVSEVLRKANA